jgi:methylated-DNA-[protein]-cysteine S-methyltransferase
MRVEGGVNAIAYAIVPTALGVFAAAWNDAGILRTWLHERTAERARQQIRRAFPAAEERPAPATIAAAMTGVAALLAGEPRGLDDAPLDMRRIPDFDRRVYEVARTIPPGETLTYGAIAKALGEEPMLARDVGQSLSNNPFAPIVPCHRVVAANGRLGGYSAPGGASTKRRLLEIEGAAIAAPGPVQTGLFEDLEVAPPGRRRTAAPPQA